MGYESVLACNDPYRSPLSCPIRLPRPTWLLPLMSHPFSSTFFPASSNKSISKQAFSHG
ncbi:hypothetical protein BRO54_2101 [Geobacillus proteiniphilus]|uniref:Uncharacterized protein n=1 Tax=Geobacillus proteiniphilus TaxID=860353 RepID=A0A1Q5SYE1_9BACL|nr:hypothetical protein BRO54_2101 [Geobacillus proteiniphilus]